MPINATGPPGEPGGQKNRKTCRRKPQSRTCSIFGFTLIELIAVIAVIGLIAAIVFPRIISTDDEPQASSERLAVFLTFVGERASMRRLYYRLEMPIGGSAIALLEGSKEESLKAPADSRLKGLKLGDGVEISEVRMSSSAPVRVGKAYVLIPPHGQKAFQITLRAKGTASTIFYNPYTQKAMIDEDKR